MPRRASIGWVRLTTLACAGVLAGCAVQGAFVPEPRKIPTSWGAPVISAPGPTGVHREDWWTLLDDGAVNALVDAALSDSPSVAQAIARADEARASVGQQNAQRLPSVQLSGSAARSREMATPGTSGGTTVYTSSASTGPTLAWELDLFGRVRKSVDAARARLDARSADADAARLSLTADVATDVLAFRACRFSVAVSAQDIASRTSTLELTKRRIGAGMTAPVDESRAVAGLSTAQTNLASQSEQCTRLLNALVALSGSTAADVDQALEQAQTPVPTLPTAPAVRLGIPARVLAGHPSVRAAESEAEAAWSDIAVARAERLPRIDLAAALSGQWLRSAGTTIDYVATSFGPSVTAPLFDGGAGAARVDAALARYQAAAATLRAALRTAVEDVENGLAAVSSAQARLAPAIRSRDAAQVVVASTEAQWRAGAVSLFELEDARRQYASAQNDAIASMRDSGQAWIALVRASGNAAITFETLIK